MKKHILIATTAALFGFSPLAAMAQDRTVPDESSHAVKRMEAPSTGSVVQGRSVGDVNNDGNRVAPPDDKSMSKASGTPMKSGSLGLAK